MPIKIMPLVYTTHMTDGWMVRVNTHICTINA